MHADIIEHTEVMTNLCSIWKQGTMQKNDHVLTGESGVYALYFSSCRESSDKKENKLKETDGILFCILSKVIYSTTNDHLLRQKRHIVPGLSDWIQN